MSELKRLERAFILADQQGNTEDARAFAKEIKRLQGGRKDEPSDLIGYAARGAVRDASFLPDLIVKGTKAIMPGVQSDIDINKTARAGINKLVGSEFIPEEEPRYLSESIAQGAGGAVASIPTMMMGGAGLARLGGKAGQIGAAMVEGVKRRPVLTAISEAASGAGAGGAGFAAQKLAPDSPLAELAASLVGGYIGPAATGAVARGVKAVAPNTLVGMGARQLARASGQIPGLENNPLARRANAIDEVKSNKRVQKRLKEIGDEDQILANMREESLLGLTPAQMSGNDRVLELEAGIANEKRDFNAFNQRENQLKEAAGRLQTEMIPDETGGAVVSQKLSDRKNLIRSKLTETRDKAIRDANEKLESLAPTSRESARGQALSEELRKNYDSALELERTLWSEVENLPQDYRSIRKGVEKRILNNAKPYVNLASRIDVIRDFLDPKGIYSQGMDTNDIIQLRSVLGRRAAEARSQLKDPEAKVLEDIRDELLDFLHAKKDDVRGIQGQAVRDALDYSASLKETFESGQVGKFLRPSNRVEQMNDRELMKAIMGTGKIKGAVRADRLGQAISDNQNPAVRDQLLGMFERQAVRDGQVNPRQAERFLQDNADLLDNFPQVRQGIEQAIGLTGQAAKATRRVDRFDSLLNDRNRSAIGRYLSAPVDQEVNTILKSPDPKRTSKLLLNAVNKDPEARDALSKAAFAYVSREATNANGEVDPTKLLRILSSTPSKKSGILELMGSDQFKRLEKIAMEAERLSKAQKAKNTDLPINDLMGYVSQFPARLAGAAVGRSVMPGTVQGPGMFSNLAVRFTNIMNVDTAPKVLMRALNDPDFYEILVKGNTINPTLQEKIKQTRRLNAWVSGPGRNFLEELEGQENE
jgi:hypothetical protein